MAINPHTGLPEPEHSDFPGTLGCFCPTCRQRRLNAAHRDDCEEWGRNKPTDNAPEAISTERHRVVLSEADAKTLASLMNECGVLLWSCSDCGSEAHCTQPEGHAGDHDEDAHGCPGRPGENEF